MVWGCLRADLGAFLADLFLVAVKAEPGLGLAAEMERAGWVARIRSEVHCSDGVVKIFYCISFLSFSGSVKQPHTQKKKQKKPNE